MQTLDCNNTLEALLGLFSGLLYQDIGQEMVRDSYHSINEDGCSRELLTLEDVDDVGLSSDKTGTATQIRLSPALITIKTPYDALAAVSN